MSREAYSEMMRKVINGEFVYTGETRPVKTTDLTETIETAKMLKDYVTGINVTDNPTAFAYMPSLVGAYAIQRETGLEAVYQITCRDRNRLALLSDVLAAGYFGIKNIIAMSGDHTSIGDNPQALSVYDLDSAGLTYMIKKVMNEGVDLAGNKIENPPKFFVGITGNPNADPLEAEILKIKRKAIIGADFVQTNVVYDIDIAKKFIEELRSVKMPVLIGTTPLKSIAMMKWMDENVPGVSVPDEIKERMIKAKATGGKAAIAQENVVIFSEFIRALRKTTHAAGVHIMAVGYEKIVPQIIEAARGD